MNGILKQYEFPGMASILLEKNVFRSGEIIWVTQKKSVPFRVIDVDGKFIRCLLQHDYFEMTVGLVRVTRKGPK